MKLYVLGLTGMVGICLAACPAAAQPQLVSQYDLAICGAVYPTDANGVVLVPYEGLGKQYNPVTISQTALGCYHTYKRTGDNAARQEYLNQIHWLIGHAASIGTDMAAYEYQFPWAGYGLKSGWHSGLAQGQAISALIRYHYDTGDASVLPLIRKLKNFLFLPRVAGGVLDNSPEGGIWFEEYPSDPPSFVWNGNVSTVFGLYEFTQLFPDDAEAKQQFDRAISSLKASLPAYDIGTWTVLDRKSRPYPRATNGYAIGHAFQLRTLSEITDDPFFKRAWLRWHSFYVDANFDVLGNMTMTPAGPRLLPRLPAPMPPDRLAGNIEPVDITPTLEGSGIETLFDRRDDTYFAPANEGETHIDFRLKHPIKANFLSIGLYNPALYPKSLRIEIKACGDQMLVPVDYQIARSRLVLTYYFKEQNICEMRISSSDNAGQHRTVLSEMALGEADQVKPELPAIGSYITPVYEMTEAQFSVHLIADRSPDASTAMYRCADTVAEVEKHGWIFDLLDPFRGDSRPVSARYCQFEFMSDPAAAGAGWHAAVEGGKIVSAADMNN